MSMSQQLVTAKNSEIQIDDNTFLVLKQTLYKEAKSDASIHMVIGYCVGRNIDPLLKAVHIVPMWNKDKQANEDVIMPGIGLYRIIAARSGQYAGMSEPVFGPPITEKVGSVTITYPEWCMVTVKKFIQGHIVEFPAKEYWIENYASVKKADPTPNYMWQKRKYGQLAKCAEAQALRKAFPEVGHDYTYEELQGKTFDNGEEFKKSFDVVKSLPVKQAVVEQEAEEYDFDIAVEDINGCLDFSELTKVYTAHFMEAKKRRDVNARSKLVTAYAKKKSSLESFLTANQDIKEFLNEYDATTGEVENMETAQ